MRRIIVVLLLAAASSSAAAAPSVGRGLAERLGHGPAAAVLTYHATPTPAHLTALRAAGVRGGIVLRELPPPAPR